MLRPRRSSRRSPHRLLAAVLAAGLLLGACSTGDGSSTSVAEPGVDGAPATSGAAPDPAMGAPQEAGLERGADGISAEDDAELSTADPNLTDPNLTDPDVTDPGSQRDLVVTASVLLEAADPRAAFDRAAQMTRTRGGHLQSQQVVRLRAGSGLDPRVAARDHPGEPTPGIVPPGGHIPPDLLARMPDQGVVVLATLRVPADDLDDVVELLGDAGVVHDESRSASDVSDQLVDLDARIETLRRAEQELSSLFEQATTSGRDRIEEIVYLLDRLGPIREQIERLEASQAALREQVSHSTLHLVVLPTLQPAADDVASVPDSFDPGATARRAVAELGRFASAVLDGVIYLGIWSLPVFAMALPLVALLRRRRRGSDARDREDPSAPSG